MKSLSLFRRKSPQRWKNRKNCGLFHIEKEKRRINKWKRPPRQDSRMAIRKNCGQNYIFVVLHFNLFGLAKQATSRTHLIDFLPSINEEDSYRFSDSRSLMSKLPRRVSGFSGIAQRSTAWFLHVLQKEFTCLDTTVYSFRSHISPQT